MLFKSFLCQWYVNKYYSDLFFDIKHTLVELKFPVVL